MSKYEIPDVAEWGEEDPRRQITGFDEEFLRSQYNEWMPPEQPALDSLLGLTLAEEMLADEAERVGGSALDIGCGNGKLLVTFAKRGYIESGLGVDISDEMANAARQTAENNNVELSFGRTSFELFDAKRYLTSLSPNKGFDLIIATEVLEHIYALRDMLGKVNEYLAPSGSFIGTVPRDHICDAVVHLHYFNGQSLGTLLSPFFRYVHVEPVDVTGEGECHLVFICRNPREVLDE